HLADRHQPRGEQQLLLPVLVAVQGLEPGADVDRGQQVAGLRVEFECVEFQRAPVQRVPVAAVRGARFGAVGIGRDPQGRGEPIAVAVAGQGAEGLAEAAVAGHHRPVLARERGAGERNRVEHRGQRRTIRLRGGPGADGARRHAAMLPPRARSDRLLGYAAPETPGASIERGPPMPSRQRLSMAIVCALLPLRAAAAPAMEAVAEPGTSYAWELLAILLPLA